MLQCCHCTHAPTAVIYLACTYTARGTEWEFCKAHFAWSWHNVSNARKQGSHCYDHHRTKDTLLKTVRSCVSRGPWKKPDFLGIEHLFIYSFIHWFPWDFIGFNICWCHMIATTSKHRTEYFQSLTAWFVSLFTFTTSSSQSKAMEMLMSAQNMYLATVPLVSKSHWCFTKIFQYLENDKELYAGIGYKNLVQLLRETMILITIINGSFIIYLHLKTMYDELQFIKVTRELPDDLGICLSQPFWEITNEFGESIVINLEEREASTSDFSLMLVILCHIFSHMYCTDVVWKVTRS